MSSNIVQRRPATVEAPDDRVIEQAAAPVILVNNPNPLPQYPELMTQEELIRYLRLPDVSSSTNYKDSIKYLVRIHELPCIHISRQPLYPLEGVRQWIVEKMKKEMTKNR